MTETTIPNIQNTKFSTIPMVGIIANIPIENKDISTTIINISTETIKGNIIIDNEFNCYKDSKSRIINQICFENFIDIVNNIKQICENHLIINSEHNSSIYGYKIKELIEKNYIDKNLIYINFTNSINEIMNKFSIKNDTIYVLIVEIPSDYNYSSSNDFSFMLFLENGTELNLSILTNLKINISVPMTNLNSLNIDYAEYFKKQGYDIYDINSNFYYDVCSPVYYEENDITINDRNLEVYPSNISINKNNCTYKSANLENKTFLYECDFTEYYQCETLENENDNDEQEPKFINYFFDLINYKIIFCTEIIKHFKNYKNNIGVIISSIIFFINIIFTIIFFSYDLRKIRFNIYKDIQSNIKLQREIIQKEKKHKISIKENKNEKIKNKENKKNKKEEKVKEKINNKNNKKDKNKKKDKKENRKEIKDKNQKDKNKNKYNNNKKKNKKSNPIKKRNNNKLKINSDNNTNENGKSKYTTNINILANKSKIQLV